MAHDQNIFIPLNKRRPDEQPRERLAKYGVQQLRTSELIALILRAGGAGKSAVDLSDQLLQRYDDDLPRMSHLGLSEIKSNPGFGIASGSALLAAFELGRRTHHAMQDSRPLNLKSISDVARFFRKEFGAEAPEKFVALYINRSHKLLGSKLISKGGHSAVVVDPREVFKEALLLNASAVILAHNHPSNDLAPSKHDIALTEELTTAGNLFRIPVAEHVIIANNSEIGIIKT